MKFTKRLLAVAASAVFAFTGAVYAAADSPVPQLDDVSWLLEEPYGLGFRALTRGFALADRENAECGILVARAEDVGTELTFADAAENGYDTVHKVLYKKTDGNVSIGSTLWENDTIAVLRGLPDTREAYQTMFVLRSYVKLDGVYYYGNAREDSLYAAAKLDEKYSRDDFDSIDNDFTKHILAVSDCYRIVTDVDPARDKNKQWYAQYTVCNPYSGSQEFLDGNSVADSWDALVPYAIGDIVKITDDRKINDVQNTKTAVLTDEAGLYWVLATDIDAETMTVAKLPTDEVGVQAIQNGQAETLSVSVKNASFSKIRTFGETPPHNLRFSSIFNLDIHDLMKNSTKSYFTLNSPDEIRTCYAKYPKVYINFDANGNAHFVTAFIDSDEPSYRCNLPAEPCDYYRIIRYAEPICDQNGRQYYYEYTVYNPYFQSEETLRGNNVAANPDALTPYASGDIVKISADWKIYDAKNTKVAEVTDEAGLYWVLAIDTEAETMTITKLPTDQAGVQAIRDGQAETLSVSIKNASLLKITIPGAATPKNLRWGSFAMLWASDLAEAKATGTTASGETCLAKYAKVCLNFDKNGEVDFVAALVNTEEPLYRCEAE